MTKQSRKEKIELGEIKKLIDCLIGEVRELKRIMFDIQDAMNAVPIVEPKMPSSPTDITMETSKQVEAVVEPVTINLVVEPPVASQPVEEVKEEQKPPDKY